MPSRGHRRRTRVALKLIRLASYLVPRSERTDWRREWEGEVSERARQMESSGSDMRVGVRLDLIRRAAGSFIDALRVEREGATLSGAGQDLSQAVRSLLRQPIFAGTVILILAVGIGANAAIFALARDVLLQPFNYPDPDRVVAVVGVTEGFEGGRGNVSYPNVFDLAERASTMTDIAALRGWQPALKGVDGAVVLKGGTVTANYFEILGVPPGAGRFFRPEDEGTGRAPRVVLSHAFWQARFGGNPDLIGQSISLNGTPYEVIGVTSADYDDPLVLGRAGAELQLWRTVGSPPSEWPRSGRSWKAVGRVRPGVSLEAAREEISGAMASLVEAFPEHNTGRRVRLVPIRERISGPSRPVLLTLLGSVTLLLMVGCANLANLMLSRALDRRREFAVMRALGASGWRLARRCMSEALVLAVVGGATGLLLAVLLRSGLARVGSLFIARPVSGNLDPSVIMYTAAVTLGTGLLFGLAPALHASRVGAAVPGKEEGRSHTAGVKGRAFQRGLVVSEVALTAVLLVGAGLLLRSFQRLGLVNLGLRTDGVVVMELHGAAWWDLEPQAAEAQWHAVLDAVRAIPGVNASGAIDYVPLGGSYSCDFVGRADRPFPEPGEGRCAETRSIFPGALEALGISLVRGRYPSRSDRSDSRPVVVVDATMAEAFWPDENSVGKPLYVHTRVHEVVGVVSNIRHFGPDGVVRPTVYIPAPQEGWSGAARGLSLAVRGSADPEAMVPSIKHAVWDINSNIAFGRVHTLNELRDANLAAPRIRSLLAGAFGLTATVLAMLGVGGVMSYTVNRRTREMGIRIAIGAEPSEVRRMVLFDGLRMVGIGIMIGLLTAFILGNLLGALLFEVSSRDPLVFVAVPSLLLAVGALASYLPAVKAARVNTSSALAAE